MSLDTILIYTFYLLIVLLITVWSLLSSNSRFQKKQQSITSYLPPHIEAQQRNIMPYSEYKKTRGSKVREIALISGVDVSSFKHIVDEYTTYIREHGSLKYHFTEYNAQGSPQQLKEFAEEISQRGYSLVFTYGLSATRTIQGITSLRGQETPIVFTAIKQSAANKMASLNLTGVSISDDPIRRIGLFCTIRKAAGLERKALVLIGPDASEKENQLIKGFLEENNIDGKVLVVTSVRSVFSLLDKHKENADTLITMRDTFSSKVPEKVAQWCADEKIAYLSSNLYDIPGGAAIAISRQSKSMGEQAARQTIAVLDDHKNPGSIPVYNIGEDAPFEMHINIAKLKEQGIDLTAIINVALDHGVTWEIEARKEIT